MKEVSIDSLLAGLVDVDLAAWTDSFAGFQLGSKMTTCSQIRGWRVTFGHLRDSARSALPCLQQSSSNRCKKTKEVSKPMDETRVIAMLTHTPPVSVEMTGK